MAALRCAVRRLCERALQRGGAQGRSTPAAEAQRRFLLDGPSPARRLMSTSSGKPAATAGAKEELTAQFENKREELFDLLLEVRRTQAYKPFSWKSLQSFSLTRQLAAQVKPRPNDPNWRSYRATKGFDNFVTAYTYLGFYGMLGYFVVSRNNEDVTTSNMKMEANVLRPLDTSRGHLPPLHQS